MMGSGIFGKLFGSGRKNVPEAPREIPREPMAPLTSVPMDSEGRCTCIFCGRQFLPRDVDFAYQSSGEGSGQDELFKRFVKEYNNYPVDKLPSRRIVKYSQVEGTLEPMDIIPSSRKGDPLPAGIRVDEGLLGSVRRESSPRRRAVSRFSLDEDEGISSAESSDKPSMTGRKITCMTRLCPNCHSELPDGYFDIFNIRVGFMGGRRSGKTSYITTASQVLNDRLLELKLASCTILPESRIMLEDITSSLRRAEGKMSATVRTDGSKPVFPVVMLISPLMPGYAPFFLTLLDIPGEYMDGNTNNIAGDPVSLSNELIAVIDPHMFLELGDESFSDHSEFNQDGYHDIFGRFPSSIADSLRNVRSVQVMVTKLDLIQRYAQENEDLSGALTGFQDVWDNHYEWFYQSINGEQLNNASYNAGLMIQQISRDRRQNNLMDMAEYIDQKMLGARRQVNLACSLVSSQDTTSGSDWYNSRAVFDQSVGVLDPLMRIFFWEKLLP